MSNHRAPASVPLPPMPEPEPYLAATEPPRDAASIWFLWAMAKAEHADPLSVSCQMLGDTLFQAIKASPIPALVADDPVALESYTAARERLLRLLEQVTMAASDVEFAVMEALWARQCGTGRGREGDGNEQYETAVGREGDGS